MSVLTWRNVDSPNLSGSALAVGQATRGLGSSFNDFANAIGQFGQAQTDRADAAAIQAASRITDSEAYNKALQSGTLLSDAGIDPNMISGRAAEMLASRQSALLDNDYRNSLIENQRQDNQLARERFEMDKLNNQFINTRDSYRFGREKLGDQREDLARNEQLAAQDLMYQVQQSGSDAAGARALVGQANVPDRVKQAALRGLNLLTNPVARYPGGVPGAGIGGADAVYGHGRYGMPEVPLSQGSFGQAYDFGQTLIPATRGQVGAGADKGTSAVGAYQFIGSTMETYAKKVFGENWRDVPFTFENQSKIAEALFNEAKDGNLQAVWAGLPDATPGAYKNMSFEEFQREVLPLESGMTLDEIRQQDSLARQADTRARIEQTTLLADSVDKGMAGNAAQRLGSIELDQYFKDSNNKDPDTSRAAADATKKYPSLKGTPLNDVTKWLDTIMMTANEMGTPITAAQATHVLGASMSPSSYLSIHPFNGAESGMHFDEDKMEQTLIDLSQGGNLGRDLVNKQIAADRGKLNNASQVLANAVKNAEYIRERDAAGLPVAASDRAKVEANLEKALKNHEQLTQKYSDPAYQQKLAKQDAKVASTPAAGPQASARIAEAIGAPVSAVPATGSAYAPGAAPQNSAVELLRQLQR